MKSGTGEVHMSPGMAYWSARWPELVVKCTGVGMVVTILYKIVKLNCCTLMAIVHMYSYTLLCPMILSIIDCLNLQHIHPNTQIRSLHCCVQKWSLPYSIQIWPLLYCSQMWSLPCCAWIGSFPCYTYEATQGWHQGQTITHRGSEREGRDRTRLTWV